jgi:polyisoprenoid-binding protein YceI
MSNSDIPTDPEPAGPSFPRWLKFGLLGALAALVLGYGAIFLYAKVINDSPPELGRSDLESALQVDGTSPSDGSRAAADPTDVTTPATTPATDPAVPVVAGTAWTVTDASQLGYRVKEVLFGVDTEAVGRTNQITGSMTIDGTILTQAEFVVDVAAISSDESRRDGQFRGRIMSTDEFPTATFTLTEPIELGVEPTEGAEVTVSASGDLTLRGVTNPVTFELTAKLQNGQIGVLGSIPVVFADYGIANPSIGGITTEDDGLLEFVLVFEPA